MAVGFVEYATLRINDKGVASKLRSTNKLLRDLDRSAKSLSKTLKSMPSMSRVFSGLNASSARSQVRQMSELNKSLSALRRSARAPTNIRVTVSGLKKAEGDLKKLQTQVSNLRRSSSRALTLRINIQGGPGVSQLLQALSTGKLRPITLQLNTRGARRELTYLQATIQRMTRIPGYALGGEAYAAARAVTARAVTAPLNIDDARARVRAAGMDEATAARMEAEALELSRRYQGVTQADILTASVEAAGSSDDLNVILKNMELIAKNAVIYAAAMGDSAAGAEQARKSFKAAQIQGADADPVEAERIMHAQAQAFIASGYDVQPAEMVRALQQIGALRFGMSDQALLEVMLSRDVGGRMDTAEYRMAFQELIRGTLSKKKKDLQVASGLRNPDGSANAEVIQQFAQSPLEFTEDRIIPYLVSKGVDIDDMALVQDALENQMGYNTSAARLLTGIVINREQNRTELEKALRANPDYFAENPTVRQRMTAVGAQFENMMAQALDGMLPAMNWGLDQVSTSFGNIAAGESGITDYASLAAGIIPVGLAAGAYAMTKEESRPLGAAALALTTSAAALNASAVALTASAAAGAGPGIPDASKKGGWGNWFKGVGAAALAIGQRAAPLAAVPILGGGADTRDTEFNEEMKRRSQAGELPYQKFFESLMSIIPGTDAHGRAVGAHMEATNPWLNGTYSGGWGGVPSGVTESDVQDIESFLSTLPAEGQAAGSAMATELDAAAPGWGAAMVDPITSRLMAVAEAMGQTIAASISGASVNLGPGPVSKPADTGAMVEGN